ncbi:galactokinase [Angomonas deanei]|uniref:Galactokinase galactose-binding signature/GHMP kinases N terminal domain/GHMP kinases C terminal, putative n=1 Tax=Angomonas deanei TaxID=59799 RepID=A0A7G2CA69_9TRYP|nr:galactokinase [Angomonas deanei]CAD2216760.1 Galactokinase galactose-binding signature/GHMP kinases N terminal domain/GHMP kinases C terminal, putative [Angomonas deanei]|eukprot:EPY33483.1 galactokinase [Angomonas deanei]
MGKESFTDEQLKGKIDALAPVFKEKFNVADESDVEWLLFSFAPGRINLIGEHVDYMGGWVCPAALVNGTYILVGRVKHLKKEQPAKLRFYSSQYREYFELSDTGPGAGKRVEWTNYVRGAVTLRLNYLGISIDHRTLRGVCMLIHGDVPMGAGLGTSASFGVALINALSAVVIEDYKRDSLLGTKRKYKVLPRLPQKERVMVAKQAQAVEELYCGVKVGIMGQFSAAMSDRDSFMILDCSSLTYQTYPFGPLVGNDHCFLIIDSHVRHDLLGKTKEVFNAVRSDQENAQKKISANLCKGEVFTLTDLVRSPYNYTTDGNVTQFLRQCKFFLTESEFLRSLYQVEEQRRTIEFRKVVLADHLSLNEKVKAIGALLNSSHTGMRDLLKVTIPQIDYIQRAITVQPDDVAGAKMMGGGFGGCVLALVRKGSVERVTENMRSAYKKQFGTSCDIYPMEKSGCGMFIAALSPPSNGAKL